MSMIRNASLPLLLLAGVAGCSVDIDKHLSLPRISIVDDSHVAVHASGVPDAIISADGLLVIADKNVAITPEQQDSLRRYFAGAAALHRDAAATGRAGRDTAKTAIRSVVRGLAKGDPDRIGAEVEAAAANVEAAATQVCADLSAIQAEQTVLVDQVSAFRPYAVIDSHTVTRCSRHS